MDRRLIEGLMEVVVPAVREYVDKATAPLVAQLAELRAREPIKGEPGEPGKSVTIDDVRPLIVQSLAELPKPVDGKDGTPGRDGIDGKSVTLDDVRPLVEEAVAAIPKPADGKDGANGRDGVDGKSITIADVMPLVDEAVAAIPKPLDGKDGAPGVDGIHGKDGVGLAGAVIDRDGELVVTLTDGTHRKLGAVVGKNGEPGKDGLGFENFEEVMEDGGRVIVRRYSRGDEVKEFRFVTATVIDRGVWKERAYQWGDSVSHGGSTWIAQKDTETKPDTPDSDWRLSAKRGRDGKDFRPDVVRDVQPVKFR